jgi:hypothetical protein
MPKRWGSFGKTEGYGNEPKPARPPRSKPLDPALKAEPYELIDFVLAAVREATRVGTYTTAGQIGEQWLVHKGRQVADAKVRKRMTDNIRQRLRELKSRSQVYQLEGVALVKGQYTDGWVSEAPSAT